MRQVNTPSEYEEQVNLFSWAASQEHKYPELKYLFSTLNGVRLTIGQAKKAKRSGNKRGVPDIWLPLRLGGANGLVVELKVKGNTTTPEQKEWLNELANNGWMTRVAYGADEAKEIIKGYLCGKDFQDVPVKASKLSVKVKRRADNPRCTNCRWVRTEVCKQCPYKED